MISDSNHSAKVECIIDLWFGEAAWPSAKQRCLCQRCQAAEHNAVKIQPSAFIATE